MSKVRQPDSFEGAVTLIAATIGFDTCAAAIGKSEGLIRVFTDPDQDTIPNLRQAMELDAAYIAATNEAGPLAAVYCDKLRERVGELKHQPLNPLLRLARIGAEVGDVHQAVIEAKADNKITKAERAKIVGEVNDAIKELQKLLRDIGRE